MATRGPRNGCMTPRRLDRRETAGSLLRVFPYAVPFRVFLILLIGTGFAAQALRAELTAEQKKALFRKSHPGASGGSKHSSGNSSQSKKSSSSAARGSSKKHAGSHPGSPTNHSAGGSSKKKSPAASQRGRHAAPPQSHEEHRPSPPAGAAASAAPAHPAPVTDTQTSLPLPHGAAPSAPITIEKSGAEEDQGLEPAPAPPTAPEGFWSRLFGSGKSYAYLAHSVRAAIDRAPVRKGRWKYIVVHNSGTREGNARVFDIYHKRVRHMQNGLAYHFVIGDGHGSGDGQIEIGSRWTRQINGGHVASDYLNDIALGICLVGDFNRDLPTKAQVGALEELVAYLRNRIGKSRGRQAIVHAHKEINPRPTDCPGDRFPYDWLHAKFGNER